MHILILGSGGRENAMAWKIAQSKLLTKLFIAPGNAGSSEYGDVVDLKVNNFEAIKDFVLQENIEMVVVGPEDPLVNGIHDFFASDEALKNVAVIGPKKEGAMLEGSKDFSKQFLQKHNIPTAKYETFGANDLEKGCAFLETLNPPYVLKADGLAAGKGVLILDNLAEAKQSLKEMLLDEKFGKASSKVVIEEFLDGIELSVFVLTDGENYLILPEAKDYKRIGEGDTGLNTGGMGAVSPVFFADDAFMKKIEERIVKQSITGLAKDNIDYQGFLFIGLMNVNGEPYVIEYNVRMGDPETEAVMLRIKNDLLELFVATSKKELNQHKIEIDERTACTVILVSGGYPEAYEKGAAITGLDKVKDVIVFQAGTKKTDNKIVTNGGRVLAVSAYGKNKAEALEKIYKNAEKIHFDKMYYRKDIGFDLED